MMRHELVMVLTAIMLPSIIEAAVGGKDFTGSPEEIKKLRRDAIRAAKMIIHEVEEEQDESST